MKVNTPELIFFSVRGHMVILWRKTIISVRSGNQHWDTGYGYDCSPPTLTVSGNGDTWEKEEDRKSSVKWEETYSFLPVK